MKEINAKGLVCPQPLILTKKAVESSDEKDFLVIVDNDTAVKNLEKLILLDILSIFHEEDNRVLLSDKNIDIDTILELHN